MKTSRLPRQDPPASSLLLALGPPQLVTTKIQEPTS